MANKEKKRCARAKNCVWVSIFKNKIYSLCADIAWCSLLGHKSFVKILYFYFSDNNNGQNFVEQTFLWLRLCNSADYVENFAAWVFDWLEFYVEQRGKLNYDCSADFAEFSLNRNNLLNDAFLITSAIVNKNSELFVTKFRWNKLIWTRKFEQVQFLKFEKPVFKICWLFLINKSNKFFNCISTFKMPIINCKR